MERPKLSQLGTACMASMMREKLLRRSEQGGSSCFSLFCKRTVEQLIANQRAAPRRIGIDWTGKRDHALSEDEVIEVNKMEGRRLWVCGSLNYEPGGDPGRQQ
jgi:hypothetical protein